MYMMQEAARTTTLQLLNGISKPRTANEVRDFMDNFNSDIHIDQEHLICQTCLFIGINKTSFTELVNPF